MTDMTEKRIKKQLRHKRVRSRIIGTSERPRFSVFRSNRHLWAQLIDDSSGRTVAAAGDLEIIKSKVKNQNPKIKGKKSLPTGRQEKSKAKGKRVDLAVDLGALIAQKALEKKITQAVFDRGGYKYHGIVKAAAEGARRGGLKF